MLARATVRGREMGTSRGARREPLAARPARSWSKASCCRWPRRAIGVLLAYGGVDVLKAWMPDGIPRVADIAIDLPRARPRPSRRPC